MGLEFGWKTNDVRETIWKDDNSLVDVPDAAIESWQQDGDASHLLPYAKLGNPEVFTFRPLDIAECRHVIGLNPESDMSGYLLQLLDCFRLGVDFPHGPVDGTMPSGQRVQRNERVRGMRMLSKSFCQALDRRYPGIIGFYGGLIFKASYPSPEEKKASSPLSTGTPSSAVGSTPAATVEAVKAEEAAA